MLVSFRRIFCLVGNYIESVGLFLRDILEYLEGHIPVVATGGSSGIHHIELAVQFHLYFAEPAEPFPSVPKDFVPRSEVWHYFFRHFFHFGVACFKIVVFLQRLLRKTVGTRYP